jgi:RHS repeat-associated protein
LSLQQPTGAWTNGFSLDDAGRITGVTSPAGTFTYSFDPMRLGLVNRLLLPNSAYVTNTYGPLARLQTNSLNNSSDTPLDYYAYAYNSANQRTALYRSDNTSVAFSYDKIGQLTVADSSVNSEDCGYYYDSAWNLNRRTNNGVTSIFTVDNKNELTTGPGVVAGQGYDSNGNLVTSHNGKVELFYDDENRLVQWFSYQTSDACLKTNDLRTDFFYDGLSRLRKRLEYSYQSNNVSCGGSSAPAGGGAGAPPPSGGGGGPCNIGAWQLVSETDYIYDGHRVIQERDGNHTPTVSYTRGPDLSGTLEGAGGIGGLLARSSGYSSGNWSSHYFYHADGNGNVTYMLDGSQAMIASYRYDPFGNLISSSGSLASANVYRFSSKEIHVNSGMYDFLYRFYDPFQQRWINHDPIAELGGINLYSLAGDDPVNGKDWLGLLDVMQVISIQFELATGQHSVASDAARVLSASSLVAEGIEGGVKRVTPTTFYAYADVQTGGGKGPGNIMVSVNYYFDGSLPDNSVLFTMGQPFAVGAQWTGQPLVNGISGTVNPAVQFGASFLGGFVTDEEISVYAGVPLGRGFGVGFGFSWDNPWKEPTDNFFSHLWDELFEFPRRFCRPWFP